MATACNDGHIRLFSVSDSFLMCTLQGVFGSPLCLDVSKDSNLLIAGFEDDTFLIYQMIFSSTGLMSAAPLALGIGHKSFVCQVRFDNYLMDFMSQQVPEMLNKSQPKIEGLSNLAGGTDQPPSLVRKISSTKPVGQLQRKQSSDPSTAASTIYRIVTGGEDSQLCFWRFEHSKKAAQIQHQKRLTNETVPTLRDTLLQIKPIRHITINQGQLQSV